MRWLTSAFRTAMREPRVRAALFIEILYPVPVRMWTGIGSKTWGGRTFTGVGIFGGVSAIQERGGTAAGNVTLSLSGIPSEMLARALADASQGCKVTIWLGLFEDDWTVIPDPWRIIRGKTDVHKVIYGGKAGTIEVTVETALASLRRQRTVRFTHEEQIRLHPGDTFFSRSASMSEKVLPWGVPPAASVGQPYMGRGRME